MLQVAESAAAGQGGAAQPICRARNMSAESTISKVSALHSPPLLCAHLTRQLLPCALYMPPEESLTKAQCNTYMWLC